MEKEDSKAIIDPKTAGEEAAVPVEAAVPIQALVEAPAAAVRVISGPKYVPRAWDLDESEEEYVAPPNPYDTCIIDNEPEVMSSDVDSHDDDVHTKARHVLRRLKSGHYDICFKDDVYWCPFYTTRRLGATDFNAVVTHAETVKTSRPNVGQTVNRYAYTTRHIALGIHLRNLQQMTIAEGRMPPIKSKVRRPKGYKFQKRMREEDEAAAEAARRRG